MDSFRQDLRFALRQVRRTPGVAAVIVLTLALAIGANTTIFSAIDGVLLSSLPYEDAGRLVEVGEVNLKTGDTGYDVSYPNFADWQNEASSFSGLAAFTNRTVTLAGGDEPARLLASAVSPQLFGVLRARPAIGRTLQAADERDGVGEHLVLLSHGAWTRLFGSDPSAVGRTVNVNGEPYAIVGVMPAGFDFPSPDVQLWVPLDLPERWRRNRAIHALGVIGRLADGVSLDRATAEMRAIAAGIQERDGQSDPEHGAQVKPLRDVIVRSARPALLLLAGAVGFVLLIACANIANLLLARLGFRDRELAVRGALGAGRWRVVRQLLTESLVLALLGGALGLMLSAWGVDLLVAALPGQIPRAAQIAVSPAVLAFAAAITLLTGLAFGALPALRASRPGLMTALKASDRGHGPARSRLRSSLAVVQISVCLVLLVGAGLMLKSFWRVLQEDPGFRPQHLLTLTVSLVGSSYDETEEVVGFYQQLRQDLERLPDVEAASGVNYLPISGGDPAGQLTIEGEPFAAGEAPSASFRRILPGYFQALGIPLVTGRDFNADDGKGDGPFVVIVNEAMARRYFPDGDAVGHRIKVGPAEDEPWLTIVGVVGDVRNIGLEQEPQLATYEPHAQRPWSTMNLVVRTLGDPLAALPSVRRAIRQLGGELPVYDIGTMERRISSSLAPRRFVAALLALFAAAALALATLGLYGLISYTVGLRTREIGIRMALGADRLDTIALVVGQGMALAGVGIVVGLAAAFGLARLTTSLLHDVSPTDAGTFVIVSALLALVTLAASYLPARKAAAGDPMVALRHE